MPVQIQLGLPQLPDVASETFFQILKMWLTICDEHHQTCQKSVPSKMPTRVIDVGTVATPIVRLYHTKPGECAHYIALTHLWGPPPHFSTSLKDLVAFSNTIYFENLPVTYQDAIITTRALGIRYLWIDSICIIRDSHDDWGKEASQMEDIFSSAYCVFSATCATSQMDGFLKPRPQRQFVTFLQKDLQEPFYVCELIDGFDMDVSNRAFYKRGWTLQERILARRTVFFTNTQIVGFQ
jgi:hypothetical protein